MQWTVPTSWTNATRSSLVFCFWASSPSCDKEKLFLASPFKDVHSITSDTILQPAFPNREFTHPWKDSRDRKHCVSPARCLRPDASMCKNACVMTTFTFGLSLSQSLTNVDDANPQNCFVCLFYRPSVPVHGCCLVCNASSNGDCNIEGSFQTGMNFFKDFHQIPTLLLQMLLAQVWCNLVMWWAVFLPSPAEDVAWPSHSTSTWGYSEPWTPGTCTWSPNGWLVATWLKPVWIGLTKVLRSMIIWLIVMISFVDDLISILVQTMRR